MAIKESMLFKTRRMLSELYISGKGIEIGALHQPLPVSEDVKVKYIDYVTNETLRQQYPELKDKAIVDIDIVDNGEKLEKIKNDSLDFIIANHFIEHCENPMGTIINHNLKLKTGGILFYAIPNKKYTFDIERKITALDHLVLDNEGFAEVHRDGHYKEYFEKVLKINYKVEEFKLIQEKYDHIHFHVWDANSLLNFINKLIDVSDQRFEIVCFIENEIELIVILKKVSRLNSLAYEDLMLEFQILNKNRDFYIWGTGNFANKTYQKLKEYNIEVKGFIDSNKTEGRFFEKEIINKNQLDKIKDYKKPYIVIGSSFYKEIAIELKKKGFIEYDDYFTNIIPL